MENITFQNKGELDRYISQHTIKHLGMGNEGTCNLLDNGWVLKKLNDGYYPEFVLQFKELNIPSFVFARYGAYIGDMVHAILMEHAEGKTIFEEKPVHQHFLTLGAHLDCVAKDIITLSGLGIVVKDFHCANIIYNSQVMKIIDTLPYLYFKKGDYRHENVCEIMNKVYEALLGDIMKFRAIREPHGFYGKQDLLENPKEYFTAVKKTIEDVTQEEVVTLEDASRVLEKRFPK